MPTHLGIELTQEVRPPVTDSSLGIAVDSSTGGPFAHRLVTIGDSLTHGFQHFAVFNTAVSWPAIVAYQLGAQFRFPTYGGPGGAPLNLEWVARQLDGHTFQSALHITGLIDQVREYYQEGPGAVLPDPHGQPNENLAVWGWDLRDTLERTADSELALLHAPTYSFVPSVDRAAHSAAISVLNASRAQDGSALNALSAASRLGEDDGGIETLCVWLGANNVLGAVVELSAVLSGPGYDDLVQKSKYTIWTVENFASEFALVVAAIRKVNARHVLWGTIPHVTIPPVTHGLGGQLAACGRYFNFYARPWQTDETFRPRVDRNLTGMDAWAIDTIIDHYNGVIEQAVRAARTDGLDWRIVDLCAVLDLLAVRRNEELGAAPEWLTSMPNPVPEEYGAMDTRFFLTDERGSRVAGGLFGLDGVHPTTAGYGIVAKAWIDVMTAAGVSFTDGPDGASVDFSRVLALDSLNSNPPAHLDDALSFIRRVDSYANLLQRLLPGQLPF